MAPFPPLYPSHRSRLLKFHKLPVLHLPDHVGRHQHVTLFIELDRSESGLPFGLFDVIGDPDAIGRLRGSNCLKEEHGSHVTVDRVGPHRSSKLLFVPPNDSLGLLDLRLIRGEGNKRTLRRLAGDLDELFGPDTVAADKDRLHPQLAHLLRQQNGLRIDAAVKQRLWFALLDRRQNRSIVFFSLGDASVVDRFDLRLLQRSRRFIGQSLSVGGLVVQHRHPALLQPLYNEVGRHTALLIVSAAYADDVPQTALSKLWIRRRRGKLHYLAVAIDIGGWNRATAVEMADDPGDPFIHELVGDRTRLLRIVLVVTPHHLDLLTEQPSFGVPLLYGDDRTVLQLLSHGALIAGQRAGHANLYTARRVGVAGNEQDQRQSLPEPQPSPSHYFLLNRGRHDSLT